MYRRQRVEAEVRDLLEYREPVETSRTTEYPWDV